MAISKDAFTPNRGTQDQIIKAAIENGNIYFSKDTNQIFCDIDGERHTMSHDGVRFLYGYASSEDIGVDTINEKYTIPKSKINASPYPHYELDMIIVNIPDSTFYRVNEITDEDVVCSKILVSGSGGGGGSDDKVRLMAIPDPITKTAGFNGSYRYGANISAIFKVRDPLNLLPTVNYKVEYSEKKGAPVLKTEGPYPAIVGEEFTITLDGSILQPGQGKNYVKIIVTPSDGREESFLEYDGFTIFDVTFQPTAAWDDLLKSVITNTRADFNFTFNVSANMKADEMKISREYIFDDIYPYKPDNIISNLGANQDNLLPFILDTGLAQSGHRVRVKATMSYKGMLEGGEITLFDQTYSFGYYKGADAPVIWIDSPYGDEVLNYTIIKLKYIVYDPKNPTSAEVQLYTNSKLARTDTFNANEKAWSEWQIVDYEVNTLNTFMVSCRDAHEEISITVKDNTAINLDPEKNGCALFLSAAGRSNKESALNRAQWNNKITTAVTGVKVGEVELRNFNWATNGWINLRDYDPNDEDTQVLRINNGAEVHIPLEAMNNATAQARTYEFDFKVRNATNYSRLVQYTAVKAPTDDDPNRETISKEIITDGTGTFLSYYGNNKGIMLGTQEAFFAIGKTSVLNVRYTDNERVKISFAVDPNGVDVGKKFGMIYVYINSVLTGVYNFDKDINFENSAKEIVINSNYCDVDLYNIRVYNTFLNYDQITQNWVGDATGLKEKMNRYNRNQAILDKITRKDIDFTAAMQSGLIPIMVIKTYDMRNSSPKIDKLDDKLPYSKIEKRAVDVRFYNPANTKMNFHAQNVICQVQGTSSEGYPRRNFKIKLKQGDSQLATIRPFKFELWDGLDSTKDQYYDDAEHTQTDYISSTSSKGKYNLFDSIAQGNKESTFCLKADFMDSSSTHNTCLANLIQNLSKDYGAGYDVRHPLIKDFGIKASDYSYLRTTVYGFPMIIFHENSKGKYEYIGKYNFNLDKSDTDTFGFSNENLNKFTEHKEGVQVSLPYTAKMCARLDEALQTTIAGDGALNCVQYWNSDLANTVKALATYQATVGPLKGYVGSIPANAHKIVKPLKWKNSTIMNPTTSGARQMDAFAQAFDAGVYVWQYQADGTWSIFKAQSTVPATNGQDLQPNGAALDTGITVTALSNTTPGYENYSGTAKYITSKYNIEFEVYDSTKLVEGTQFYLLVTEEITYPYSYTEEGGISKAAKPFKEVAECWEFTDNQAGMGKFQIPKGADTNEPFYTLVTEADGLNRFLASKSFEMRYLPSDVNIIDEYNNRPNDILAVNEQYKSDYKNLEKVWTWTASTDTKAATNAPLEHAVYEVSIAPSTRDKSYYIANPDVVYYVKEGNEYKVREVKHILKAAYSTSSPAGSDPSFTDDGTKLINFIKAQLAAAAGKDVSEIKIEEVIALYTFNKKDDNWYYGDTVVNLDEIGVNVPADFAKTEMNFSIDDYYQGFQETNVILYEKFETDNARYRLSKFKTEFDQHWDKAYCLFYFVLTEFLLLYDSRQKNMMIASWGPRTQTISGTNVIPGNYIWYPIFYDMDTQLGINNSGQVYWDYDVDATPLTGGDSIFSGNGSTLWDNFFSCFYPEIQQMYRLLRKGIFQYDILTNYYDTDGSDKWSETMKNIDADFKYIAPASKERGYIDLNGNEHQEVGEKYFYCLQGDRKLNRDAFLRNRFNYIDSEWLAYSYDPATIGSQIKMRYNLNDSTNTSGLVPNLRSNARFKILPYLSQYVSVVYDKNATTPIAFKLSDGKPVEPIPPTNVANQETGTVALSQQLAYIRGPEYLSSLGDLSLKYLNEFDCSPAYRLRELQLGNETDGYYNRGMSTTDLVIGGGLKDTNGGKGLLSLIDLTNLNELAGSIDLSGCLKLEVFKALGTKIPSISFANGNILKRVYLPNTINNLTLLQPLLLTKLITSKDNAKDNVDGNIGLYVQDLTDKLDTPNDTSIKCLIDKLYISNDRMNFESYKIFNFLYQVKKNIISGDIVYADTATMNDKLLSIRLENVNWSEYSAVDPNQEYSSATITNYYKKLPNNTYEQLTTAYTAAQWNAEKYDGVLYYKDTEITNPITNLDFFTQVCEQFDDDVTYPDKTNFYFRDIYDDITDPQKKVIPLISGHIHVNNDASHPIDEERITNYYNTLEHFPKLEITANYITESYRATFVEYLEADENNARKVLYTQKVSKTAPTNKVTYYGETPSRNHRDFQGWMMVVKDTETAGDYQIRESDVRKAGSVLSASDVASKKVYSTTGLVGLNLADYPNGVTFVAIYTVHQYPVYFYEYDYQTVFKNQPVMINSGEYMHAPEGRPYKPIEGAGTLYRCYKFIGWTNSMSGSTPLDITRIRVQSEMRMYPLFEEDSVYNNPLTVDELLYSWNTVQKGWYVGIKQDVVGKTAKICFPNTLTADGHENGPVIGVMGKTPQDGSVNTNGLFQNPNITHVFFQGMPGQDDERTCYLVTIGESAFQAIDGEGSNLVYVDLPTTLTSIGNSAFAFCNLSMISELPTFAGLGNNKIPMESAFINAAHVGPIDEWPNTLVLSGNIAYIGSRIFSQAGWSNYIIGSKQAPLTQEIYQLYVENNAVIWNDRPSGIDYYLPIKITIYASKNLDAAQVKATFESKVGSFETNYPSGNLVEVIQ